jgi:hypothetical protein
MGIDSNPEPLAHQSDIFPTRSSTAAHSRFSRPRRPCFAPAAAAAAALTPHTTYANCFGCCVRARQVKREESATWGVEAAAADRHDQMLMQDGKVAGSVADNNSEKALKVDTLHVVYNVR